MLGPQIALTADRKPYAGTRMVLSDLTCGDLEKSLEGHMGLNGLIPWKRCMFGPRIALTADRKRYAVNQMVLSDLTCDDLGGSYQGQLGLYGLIPWKWCILGPGFALTADSKQYTCTGNPMALSDLSYNHFESSGHFA